MLLAGGLENLAERERQIVSMRFEEGLTQSQIAARIGISQMHVSRLLRRALAQLRNAVGETPLELVKENNRHAVSPQRTQDAPKL